MHDTLIHRKVDGSTKITIYRKPTHANQYILMDSHHPLQHKLGVIRTLMHRAETLVTEEEDKGLEIEKIKKALGVCVDTNGLTSQSRMLAILATVKVPLPPIPTGALSSFLMWGGLRRSSSCHQLTGSHCTFQTKEHFTFISCVTQRQNQQVWEVPDCVQFPMYKLSSLIYRRD